jgi:hypothetical protein
MAALSKTTNAVNRSKQGFLYSRSPHFFQDFSETRPERQRRRLNPGRWVPPARLTCEAELPKIIPYGSMSGCFIRIREEAEMEPNSEKRCENRQSCDAAIEWAYFNRGECFSARMMNFSKGGSYFVSVQPLLPGATILIRLLACDAPGPESRDRSSLRTTALGEVKWCRELGSAAAGRFGIGIRYHFPV